MDLVSVIIPYYKKRKFIKNTINSVIKQTYKNLEIIIVYDDEDLEDLTFISDLKKNDARIILIQNKFRVGAGISRNLGIDRSAGKYLAFLDADDNWVPEKLDVQISYMKKNNFQASHTSYLIIDDKKKIIGNRTAKNICSLKELLKSCDIGLSTVILEKKLLIENDIKFPNLTTKEDFVVWLQILKKGISFYAIDKNLTIWTKLDQSLSSSTIQKLQDGFKVYNYFMGFNFLKSLYYLFILSFNFIKKK